MNKKAKEAAKEDILDEMIGNGTGIREGKKSFSAADVNVRANRNTLWARHKEDAIDRIVKNGKYSDWQRNKYRIKVDFPSEVKEIKTFEHDFDFKEASNSRVVYRKADFNYDRRRIAAD